MYVEFSWFDCPIPGSNTPSEAHVVHVAASDPQDSPIAIDIGIQGDEFYYTIASKYLDPTNQTLAIPETLRILRSELVYVRHCLERFLHPTILQVALLQASYDAVDETDHDSLVAMTFLTRHAAELLLQDITKQAT